MIFQQYPNVTQRVPRDFSSSLWSTQFGHVLCHTERLKCQMKYSIGHKFESIVKALLNLFAHIMQYNHIYLTSWG